MSTIAQLAADIDARPAPVLFLDTCALLDVARAPALSQPDDVSGAEKLLELVVQNPPAVYLLAADIVEREWKDNIASVLEVTKRAFGEFDKLNEVASIAGLPGFPQQPPFHQLASRLEGLSRSLLESCRVIDRNPDALNAAIDRVVNKQKPSSPKGEVKDCYILEHCLSVASLLFKSDFTHLLLFVSSNIDDYATKATSAIHKDLKQSFNAVGLKYARTIGNAVAMLRSAGQIT